MSCQSTKVYTKYEDCIYSNGALVSKKTKDFEGEPVRENYAYSGGGNLTRETTEEKITVTNTTDYNLIAYSFFLKPLIITGVGCGNIVRCGVQSVGMFFIDTFCVSWHIKLSEETSEKFKNALIPSLSRTKEKMKEARANNALPYPEYAKFRGTFTKSHVVVEKTTTKTANYQTGKEEIIVTSYERYEYDNTIFISREIKKDALSTVYVTNYVGNIVTYPIYVCTLITTVIICGLLY